MASRSLSCLLDLPAARASSLWQPLPQHSKEDSFVYSNLLYSILYCLVRPARLLTIAVGAAHSMLINVIAEEGCGCGHRGPDPNSTITYNNIRTFHVKHLLLA